MYQAIDSKGLTLDFMLSHRQDSNAAKRILKKVLSNYRYNAPRAISTDKNPIYGMAINKLKECIHILQGLEHRQFKYLNNIIESDHFRIKRLIRPMLGCKSFESVNSIIKGLEEILMIRKQQFTKIGIGIKNQIKFFNRLFQIAA